MTTRTLTIAVGVPGAGKTHLLAQSTDTVINADDVRQEMLGDASRQDANTAVWSTVHDRVRRALHKGSVAVDATNLEPAHRSQLLTIARAAGATPIAWRLPTPHDIARARNRQRPRAVPDDVMDELCDLFDRYCDLDTLTAEGWTVLDIHCATGTDARSDPTDGHGHSVNESH